MKKIFKILNLKFQVYFLVGLNGYANEAFVLLIYKHRIITCKLAYLKIVISEYKFQAEIVQTLFSYTFN